MITDFFRQGRLEELLSEITCQELSQSARKRLGKIHPSFMGGEYLPGYRAKEVEIVRIEFESTTGGCNQRPGSDGWAQKGTD